MATTHFTTTAEILELGLGAGPTKAFVYDNAGATLTQEQVYAYLLTVPLVAFGPMFSGAEGRVSGSKVYGHHSADSGTLIRGTVVAVR